MSFLTAFQPDAFQNNAFQIGGAPPPTPVVPPEDIGGGYMANPNDLAAYRKFMEERDRVQARPTEDKAELRRFVARAFGMEPEGEPNIEQVADRAIALAEFDGYTAGLDIIREIVAEEQARLMLLRQQEDDIIMVLLLSS